MSSKSKQEILGRILALKHQELFSLFLQLLEAEQQNTRLANDRAEKWEDVLRNQGGIRKIQDIVSDLTIVARPPTKNGGFGV